jgi:hypothetical protein
MFLPELRKEVKSRAHHPALCTTLTLPTDFGEENFNEKTR